MLEPFRSSHDIKPVEQPSTKGMEVIIQLPALGEKLKKGKKRVQPGAYPYMFKLGSRCTTQIFWIIKLISNVFVCNVDMLYFFA
jgi:hypothetical protein